MSWEDDWRRLARRVEHWEATARVFLEVRAPDIPASRETAAQALAHEANEIIVSLRSLELPSAVRDELDAVISRLGFFIEAPGKEAAVWFRFVSLAALKAPLTNALLNSEEPRRRLVERAFVHLNRILTVDAEARSRWASALAREIDCEKLGALHLLSHGVYAFKADAGTGRTDLILGEPLTLTDDVRTAEAMVLTEWKCVREGDDASDKASEARAQILRYAGVELAGFELRRHRYAILVSLKPIEVPSSEEVGATTIRYINLVIDRDTPSREARS